MFHRRAQQESKNYISKYDGNISIFLRKETYILTKTRYLQCDI